MTQIKQGNLTIEFLTKIYNNAYNELNLDCVEIKKQLTELESFHTNKISEAPITISDAWKEFKSLGASYIKNERQETLNQDIENKIDEYRSYSTRDFERISISTRNLIQSSKKIEPEGKKYLYECLKKLEKIFKTKISEIKYSNLDKILTEAKREEPTKSNNDTSFSDNISDARNHIDKIQQKNSNRLDCILRFISIASVGLNVVLIGFIVWFVLQAIKIFTR